MAKEFKLQDPGEGIHEAEILDVNVSEGDDVSEGDILLTVETDKAAVEVPAPFSGTIDEILVDSGDQARVGDVLIRYSETGGNGRGAVDSAEDEGGGERREKQAKVAEKGDKSKKKKKKKKKNKKKKRKDRAKAKRSPSEVREAAADDREGGTDAMPRAQQRDQHERGDGKHQGPVPAAPATRRLARELGVDLRRVSGSGPGGRVMDTDVRAAADGRERPKKTPTAAAAEREAEPAEDGFERWGPVEHVPFRSVRRATARVMSRAWREIPHVMHQENADITALEAMREDHKAAVEKLGGKLTLTPFVIKTAVAALKEFPRMNASLSGNGDGQEIVLKRYYHIGVAVATERGLVVPVLRDADRKSLSDIAVELTHLADRAREGDLSPDDMQGGSFTITNPGGIGGDAFTPIINHPEVAILGMGAARLVPVVQGSLRDAAIVPRLQMPLCLAFDHRINDGADAARFLRRVVQILGDPQYLTLHV